MKITGLIELLAALMAPVNVLPGRQRNCRNWPRMSIAKGPDTPTDSLQPRNIHCGTRFGCRPTILPHCLGLEAAEAASARLGLSGAGFRGCRNSLAKPLFLSKIITAILNFKRTASPEIPVKEEAFRVWLKEITRRPVKGRCWLGAGWAFLFSVRKTRGTFFLVQR